MDPDAERLRTAKLVLLAVVGFFTFACSLAPWLLSRLFHARSVDLINLLSALSAGIVFGSFLTHMIPDTTEAFSTYGERVWPADSPLASYPWSTLIIGCVFILLFSTDRLLVAGGAEGGSGHAHGEGGHSHVGAALSAMQRAEEARACLTGVGGEAGSGYGSMSTARGGVGVEERARLVGRSDASHGGSESDAITTTHGSRKAVVRAWVFTAAISVHALFDGLSLGAESSTTGFVAILTAVLAHKAFDGIATGAALHPAGFSLRQALGMLAFSAAMTPAGIAIGLGLGELPNEGGQRDLAEAIVISMSAGSFVFISVVELLPAALEDGRWLKRKLVAFTLGFLAMAALASEG